MYIHFVGIGRISFKSNPHAVLLATDIASRGLDIPSVDHVVHYQIPRTADAYVHRNGRTARASRKGFGMMMCAPDERRAVRGVLGSLGRGALFVPCCYFILSSPVLRDIALEV